GARLSRSVARAAEGEHMRDVGNVLAAQLLELRIVLEVIVAVGKAERRLADKDTIAVGVLEVGRQLHVEQRGESGLPEQVRECRARVGRGDARKIGLNRGATTGL